MDRSKEVKLRVTPEQKATWQAAADYEARSLADWIRLACDARAEGEQPTASANRTNVRTVGEAIDRINSGGSLTEADINALAGPPAKEFKGPDPKPEGRKKRK
jgi:hypothetical protein